MKLKIVTTPPVGTSDERKDKEFRVGLRNVTQAIADAVTAIGVAAPVGCITWEPAWKPGKPIPRAIDVRVAPEGAPVVSLDFSREQISDSWQRLERPEVRQKVRSIANEYKRLKGIP